MVDAMAKLPRKYILLQLSNFCISKSISLQKTETQRERKTNTCRCSQSNLMAQLMAAVAVVTLQTFYLGKDDLLTVYLGKLDFLSVTDFSLGNLPWGNFIVWVLDMSRKQ